MASSSLVDNGIFDGRRMTLEEYLATPETNKRFELTYGTLREPAAPSWDHQLIVGRLFRQLDDHVTRLGLGRVGLSPLDVVLDEARHLVVQPDLVFVAEERVHIIRDRIWGAPDLVVEVESLGSRFYDRRDKNGWYRECGVREQWVVSPVEKAIEIYDLTKPAVRPARFTSKEVVRSAVLPRLRLRVGRLFAD
jgi:Uma2 family endonuclease